MASIEKRGKSYRIIFRFEGQRYTRSLHTRCEKTALGALHRLEDNLRRTELGTLAVPESVDPAEFLLSDGTGKEPAKKVERSKVRTIGQLCEAYLESMPDGAIEANTRNCIDIHIRHFHRNFGRLLPLSEIDQVKLQEYVNKRSKAKGRRGMPLSPDTIKKELATLTAIWNWALRAKHVSAPLDKYGLRFPKSPQKQPFQTLDEVTRKCQLLGMSQEDREQLWDSVFLTVGDIEDLLAHVRKQDGHPFIYPMFAFAAHTGARRSEMMRSRLQDIDLSGKRAVIREKKRVRGQETTRTVPLSPFLIEVLTEWFEVHPGGMATFAVNCHLPKGNKFRLEPTAVTVDEASHHFVQALKNSKWKHIRGWHVFRHSFCSNCAASGIDQRIIDAWVGHQTEEMRRRYRHLLPHRENEAIEAVFSKPA